MKVINKEQLLTAVEYLKEGKTIIFPTETSYGLGCDATNQKAVDRIFKIKERKAKKSLLVVVPTIDMAKKYLVWNDLADKLAVKYWPGAVTVVGEYNKKENLAFGVVSSDNTIAIRVTNHPILKFLSEKLDRPAVATSANFADAGDNYDSKKIVEVFSKKEFTPDILIDGGELAHNLPTTIVSVVNNELKIIRQGDLLIKDI